MWQATYTWSWELLINRYKSLDGVKIGRNYTKWGNQDEKLLNGVINVKIVKLEGKKWNLLHKHT
jgi:hypothetical protein